MNQFERAILAGSALLVLCAVGSKVSSRFGIPALLLFLGIGLAAGPHGLGAVLFTDYEAARRLGVFALVFILFSGGVSTKRESIRPVLWPALVLATAGVLITSALVGAFAYCFMGFTILEGCLLGATVASTDVAAVFSTLRARGVSLKTGLTPLLELESALNDPMAVFLGVAILDLLTQNHRSALILIPQFFLQMILGSIFGWLSGKGATSLINRIKLEYDGLYPVLTVGWITLTYALTQLLGGSGFLAVYVSAVVIGNENLLHKRSLIHFHEGAAWLGQIGMFLALGLLVDVRELIRIAPLGLALCAFLIFVARPISVFLCFPGKRFRVPEKLMVSWAGLRGAVPIILASYVLASRIPRAADIFNLVFFVTFVSVALQGTLISQVSNWLKVSLPFKPTFRFPLEFNPIDGLKGRLLEIPIPTGSFAIRKTLLELGLPEDVLVLLIQRAGDLLVPRGGTHVLENDTLLVLSKNTSLDQIRGLLGAPTCT